MIDQVLEQDIQIESIHLWAENSREYQIQQVQIEMKAQMGYSGFLKKIGQIASESYKTCQRLYINAYDTLVRLGGDRTGFPKSIK